MPMYPPFPYPQASEEPTPHSAIHRKQKNEECEVLANCPIAVAQSLFPISKALCLFPLICLLLDQHFYSGSFPCTEEQCLRTFTSGTIPLSLVAADSYSGASRLQCPHLEKSLVKCCCAVASYCKAAGSPKSSC